jgi:diadenosine tetraphosphate (Ap4A) HIT family hydrolase
MSDEQQPARSAYHDRLPIGERLSARPLVDSPFVHFGDNLEMAPLEPMLVPEAPRGGELDPSECFHCTEGLETAIWRDEHWHVGNPPVFGLPFIAGLAPNTHVRLHEMDADLLASFGGVVQRLALAVQELDGVARTHFSRWGDGSAHFHMHFLARPLGMMQGRGPMLAFWDDVLPPLEEDMVRSNAQAVARAMAAGGGESLVG